MAAPWPTALISALQAERCMSNFPGAAENTPFAYSPSAVPKVFPSSLSQAAHSDIKGMVESAYN
jgi:hypothetical protein